MNFRDKIVSWDELPNWRLGMRASGKKLVVTNGCFDLLHSGHVAFLREAAEHGDLYVGIGSDTGEPISTFYFNPLASDE